MARILTSVLYFAALVASQKPAILQERQNFCPIPCGQGWCCLSGQKCIPGPSDDVPYQCDDPILQITDVAYQGDVFGSISTAIQSIESEVSTFIASLTSEFSITITTTSSETPVSSSSPVPTSASTGTEDTTSPPITLGAGPTRTRSPTTSTSNAAAGHVASLSHVRNTGLWVMLLGVLFA